jgi:hypothetical protein
MKIEKEVIFKLIINEDELLFLRYGMAQINISSVSEKEKQLAQKLYQQLDEAFKNA